MKSLLFVYLLIQIFAVAAQPSEDPEDAKEFIPTNEWQTISEGQQIPPGLHIRLNLETGLREAKLLGNNEQKSTSNEIIAVSPEADQEEISRKNLEKAFANLDLSKDDVQSDEAHEEDIRQRFRPYDELKKEFESLNMKIQTDQEILVTLIDQLNKTDNDDNTKTILTDLEYYLHQYDNAILFADMNGLDLLIALLNSTNTDAEIRNLASLALGAAFQGNPKVQLKALQSNCMQHLLHLLNIESDDNIILRLLFALSTLLRNFPAAQKTFLEHSGAELMIKMLDLNNKIAVRALTLMNDLITEKNHAMDIKKEAYENLHILNQLVDYGWCARISSRLALLFDTDNFDHIDKTINAMIPLIDICRADFIHLISTLDKFNTIYKHNNLNDYADIFNNIQILLTQLRQRSTDDL
ncbi:unnamed protein product [Rotaria socialis]|uniref:Nucleotide exchange factor SIL1 n=1 Tax=Rotaria socialis TaxID=392032 RepID=A0A817QNE6_9BILA|nr:unnamed protein product [Rotaria socialis]CAF3216910.1 unnamed protein product [Rotaria socialis]CAF4125781.1 unnamed protein product [Rotaria socialis]